MRSLRDLLSRFLYTPATALETFACEGDLVYNKFFKIHSLVTPHEQEILVNKLHEGPIYTHSDIRSVGNIKRFLDYLRNRVYWYDYKPEILESYDYLRDTPEVALLIADRALKLLEATLQQIYAVDTIELYRTRSDGRHMFNSSWHVDGDCKSSIRCLAYLSNVSSMNDGPLLLKTSDDNVYVFLGLSGDACFFHNAKTVHKGAHAETDRLCLNIKFRPAILRSNLKSKSYPVNYQGAFL